MLIFLNWILPAVALLGTVWVIVFIVREDSRLCKMLDVDRVLDKAISTRDTKDLLAEVEGLPSYIWWETETSTERKQRRRKFFARRKASKLTTLRKKRRKL